MDKKNGNIKRIKNNNINFKKLKLVDLKRIAKYKKFKKLSNDKEEESTSKSKITASEAKKCLEDIFDYMADNNLLDDKTIGCFLQLNDKITNIEPEENKNKIVEKK